MTLTLTYQISYRPRQANGRLNTIKVYTSSKIPIKNGVSKWLRQREANIGQTTPAPKPRVLSL